MPCVKFVSGDVRGIVCFGTEHEAKDDYGRTWRFSYTPYGGPLWITAKGQEREPPLNPRHRFWQAFNKWIKVREE